ncbi:aminopeptidase N-like isoform X2 [Belonocnema kinseyi]|uniref:aminopeptidase N-like isoform X2 n=1 Tax=Belonocnema kinseyi TaxID=2817044 RepID=UPI00143D4F85|nr:aminopeptidase N-like isoform X2 [Belonocnema kinseyi]
MMTYEDFIGAHTSKMVKKSKWLATTHFEPIGARQAFPCFDEPALKATFDISIDLKEFKDLQKYQAISNMPAIKNATADNPLMVFKTTPPMSTYLVAFVVSDFDKNADSQNKMTVWIRNQLLNDTDFARDTGTKILNALASYLGVDYQMDKMDQAGIPDFSAGAMENWGLVTYREKALVYNEKTSSASQKQSVASIIAHEFAHQWFGDHVGPFWWKFLWLNEGFATFFQDFITDRVYNFEMRDQFVVQSLQGSAFSFDVTEKSHPMNVEVESPSEISDIFDAISYQKSGSVIRMMQHILSDEIFKQGLKSYLTNKKNSAATSDDLFDALDKVWGRKDISLKTIMNTWVSQPGYPVINVTRSEKTIQIVQQRFFMKEPKEPSTEQWWVPLNYITEANVDEIEFQKLTTPSHWLKPNEKLEIENIDPEQWFIFNKQQTGYYRVNYDNENWKLIAKFLKSANFTQIHNLNRAQLLDDSWNLARAGHLSYEIAFDIMSYLNNEINYFPWYAAIRSLNYLKNQLIFTSHYHDFQEMALKMSSNLVESVGFVDKEKEDHITTLTRSMALRWVCGLGFENCTKEFEGPFNSWLASGGEKSENDLNPNLKSIVLCTMLENANETIWNRVYEKYLETEDTTEQVLILTNLGCSKNPVILKKYLDLAINTTSKINNTITAVQAVYNGNEIGLNVTLNYIVDNSHGFLIHDKGDAANLNKFISDIGTKITTEAHLKKLSDFISASKSLQGPLTTSALENAKENVEWVEKNSHVIGSLLASMNKTPKSDGSSGSSLKFATIIALIPVFIALFT